MPNKCVSERRTTGSCKPEAIYYEPNFITRTKEFLTRAKPVKI